MPDIFFRTFVCGAAAVALGAGVFIVTGRNASLEKEANTVYPADSSSTGLAEHGFVRAQPRAVSGDSYAEPPVAVDSLMHMQDAPGTAYQAGSAQRPHLRNNASASDAATSYEPVIFVGKDAIELTVPVNPQNGQPAYVPIALALAADPAGVPQPLQEAARDMAQDFLDNVADVAAAAAGPQSTDYFSRWQAAAYLSDRDFKMRYGRVAYVQMNQLLAQEAAASAR